ncbi:MAG: nitroreductase family protein [Paludibacteraceae bacterium]
MMYRAYKYDKKRYTTYSDSFLLKGDTELLGNIIKHYHIIEKGLTMPETRLGFGQKALLRLIDECELYINRYGTEDTQLQHCLAVIKEYNEFHKQQSFCLPDETLRAIEKIQAFNSNTFVSSQKQMTREQFFASVEKSFDLFSNSRASVRNFSNHSIPMDKIEAALELARNTPSACNRQSWRSYVYQDKKQINDILQAQGGNRGFGHLTDKLIVVTGELGVFSHSFERNQVFIDGGMYVMNVLYALHFYKIAGCVLNCSTTPEKDIILQDLCGTPKSEVFIAMIACGIPPEIFRIASSPRYELSKIATFN